MKGEEKKPSEASLEVASGVLAWSREGLGPQRELREALFSLNSMNFVQNVEKVCLMAPSQSHHDCGKNAVQRLACPVLLRAAIALIPVHILENEIIRPQQVVFSDPWRTWRNATASQAPRKNITLGAAPVTVKACAQQHYGKELRDMLGRFFAVDNVDTVLKYSCRRRQSAELKAACLEEEKQGLACRTIEHTALSIVGPSELSKQMAFIIGTHPIVISKNRFDILDDPCHTARTLALSILSKFLMGVLVMFVIYCCLATFCCAMLKL